MRLALPHSGWNSHYVDRRGRKANLVITGLDVRGDRHLKERLPVNAETGIL